MYLSKLGALDSAQATEYLTAILNGFQMEAEDASRVVDKLVSIDNIAATSAGELATAMQYSSAIANETGISFDNLAAMIGAVSSNTRLSAEMIGQAFKTMAVRMQSVKAGAIDETGLGLNNVEKTLSNVGIALRDSKDSFRPLEQVISDVAAKWKYLDEVQRAQISNAIAGQRQAQIFTALMQNWGDVTNYVTAETDSLGLAEKNYGIYLESIEAKQNSLRASWEKLVSGTATSEFVGSFYDGATAILDFVDSLGGIPKILEITIPLLIAFNNQWKAFAVQNLLPLLSSIVSGFTNMGVSLGILNPALMTTAAGETAVAGGLTAISASAAAANLAFAGLIYLIIGAVKAYKELRQAQEESRNGLNEIKNSVVASSSSYQEYVDAMTKAAEEQGMHVDENNRIYAEGAKGLRDYNSGIELMSEAMFNATQSVDDGDRKLESFNETLSESSDFAEQAQQSYQSLADTIGNLTDSQDSLQGLMDKAQTGGLDFTDINELAKVYPDYLNALTVENGQLKLNTDLVREYLTAKADQAVADAQAAGATQQEIDVLQAYAEQLREQQNVMIGNMQVTSQTASEIFLAIAQNAATSGNSFVDLQNNALNSADSIYKFLMSGDQAFNSFVQQAANITGKSVADIMAQINSMISQTYNNAMSMIQLGSSLGTPYSIPSSSQPKISSSKPASNIFSVAPTGYQYPGGLSDSSKGSGGKTKAEKQAEKQKKIQDQIAKAQKDAEDALKRQLDTYKDLLDVRKKLLDSMAEEKNYQDGIEEQNDKILKLQNELAILKLDNSAESQAKQLELQDELNKAQKELEDTQYQHSIDAQKDALDAEYANFEASINGALDAIKSINAKSLSEFSSQLSSILAGISQVPSFHSGAENGVVGGKSLKSNELFAKLMKGEVVSNSSQIEGFMKNTLPQIASGDSNYSNGDISVEIPINVAGSLDKSVMPDIKNIANLVVVEINKAMISRGYNRRTDLYSAG